MKKRFCITAAVLIMHTVFTPRLMAQGVAIGQSAKTAHSSAALEVHSTDKGMLIPRMTSAQKEAIASPAEGLTVYQTDAPEGIQFFDGNVWVHTETLGGGSSSGSGAATGVGINATGAAADPSAMLDVSSTTQGFLPPRMTQAQRTAIASPAEGLMMYQTDNTKGLYVYDGSDWNPLYYNHYVGESYGGGIVIHVDASGLHGIIAADTDLPNSQDLWAWVLTITLAEAIREEIGLGYQNTVDIINTADFAPDDFCAAKGCVDWIHNGYSDWYLPSIDELQLMYDHKGLLGIIEGMAYWSSTEHAIRIGYAYCYKMDIDGSFLMNKSEYTYVRAVRYF